MLSIYRCTRAIDIWEVNPGEYVLKDVRGGATSSFRAESPIELKRKVDELACVAPVTDSEGRLLLGDVGWGDMPEMPWCIERPYASEIPDAYRIWLCGEGDFRRFDAAVSGLPSAYLESGHGAGGRAFFEEIHKQTLDSTLVADGIVPREMLFAYLHCLQCERICDDIRVLVSRALGSFQRLLRLLRQAVSENADLLSVRGWKELRHSSAISYEIANQVTLATISATSSLDLATKLVAFVNETKLPPTRFRGASGKQYHELFQLNPGSLSEENFKTIHAVWEASTSLPEMIQFRHDVIHSTTAIELERNLYIGRGTECINKVPLFYAQLHWRDTDKNGQPHRYLGRDFFVDQGRDMELVLSKWLADVIKVHAGVAEILLRHFEAARSAPRHRLPGT